MTGDALFEAPARAIARVAVDVSLPHLDRLFDYEIPDDLDVDVVPGCRVTVRFAGRQAAGFVVERITSTDYGGRLQPVRKVPSSEPVLRSDVLAAARAVAQRYGGVLADVLRLAVPPRHARTEKALSAEVSSSTLKDLSDDDAACWSVYRSGSAFLTSLASGGSPRAVLTARPDVDLAHTVAAAAKAVALSGRGVVVCVPDVRALDRFRAVFEEVLGREHFAVLSASQGPSARYRSFLALSRGNVRVCLGTRAAALAPVHDIGLVAIVDDGDDLFDEPRAPYPHTREILLTRAAQRSAGVLIAGVFRTAEGQRLIGTGWCTAIEPDRDARRASWPRVSVVESREGERIPHGVFTAVRTGLSRGPVLVHVPRRGYRSALACQDCRTRARCRSCLGPLEQPSASASPACAWCARIHVDWRCHECGSARLRSPVVGALRLTEELGKAFAGIPIRRSSGDHVIDGVSAEPSIVIATPGAEPPAETAYAAAVILDTSLALGRAALRVAEEAHRRWFNVLALVRPARDGGQAVVVGEAADLQALVRTDPVGFAERELADRAGAHMPPAAHVAVVEGPLEQLRPLVAHDHWPPRAEVLGPVPVDDDVARLLVRVPFADGRHLGEAIHRLNAGRSSRKLAALKTRINPYDL